MGSSQEEADRHPGVGVVNMEDWIITQEMEDEKRTKDWLFMETLQPEKRLKQMKLNIPIVVKRAGKERDIQRKIKTLDTRREKISKKEGEEVKKTSMNIFDWFYEKQVSPGASLDSTSSGTSMEPAIPPNVLILFQQLSNV